MQRGPFGSPQERSNIVKLFEAYGAQTRLWTAPTNQRFVVLQACGGGGGGGTGDGGGTTGAGGGGASYAEETIEIIPGAQYVVTTGAAGTVGADGGTTKLTLNSFDVFSLLGGKKGSNGATAVTGGRGTGMGASGGNGGAAGGNVGVAGSHLLQGTSSHTSGDVTLAKPRLNTDVTSIPYSAGSGGATGSFSNSGGGGGAASPFGTGADGGQGNGSVPTAATGYGAGGGGGGGGGIAGGSGSPGMIIIYGFEVK